MLKEGRKDRNRVEVGLEDRIRTLFQTYNIKREAWFGDAKLNGVNCKQLIDQNEVIRNNIREIFIEINKGTAS